MWRIANEFREYVEMETDDEVLDHEDQKGVVVEDDIAIKDDLDAEDGFTATATSVRDINLQIDFERQG